MTTDVGSMKPEGGLPAPVGHCERQHKEDHIHDDATGITVAGVDNYGQHHDDRKADRSPGRQEGQDAGGVGDDDTDGAEEFGHTNKENDARWGFFGPVECSASFGGLEGFDEPSHPKNQR